MRRAALLLLVLFALVMMSACGGNPEPSPTAAPSAEAPAAAAPAATAMPTAVPTPVPTPEPTPAPPAETEAPDWAALGGTEYEGKSKGYGGYVHVTVVLDESGKILDVQVGKHRESEGYGDKAINAIPGLIIEQQSLGVDAVTGSTLTSKAILEAVAKALESAGLDPADYGFPGE